jgi:hypothetical protein
MTFKHTNQEVLTISPSRYLKGKDKGKGKGKAIPITGLDRP